MENRCGSSLMVMGATRLAVTVNKGALRPPATTYPGHNKLRERELPGASSVLSLNRDKNGIEIPAGIAAAHGGAASLYRREMVRRCWTMRKAHWPAVFARDDGRCWKRWSTLAERPLRDVARTCAATSRDSRRLLAGRSDAGWTRCATSQPLLVEALHVAGCALPCARVRP
ncbi:hypothetical protein F511_02983 [Dorcoceras hygrometricum]|uniref:Uncharacterized protein n=1 Tax=Dorcoceras hygrometricum TaxID=472368 RepID=A0A2Z7A6C6_9LAMI|nr:hypothetical protein F511_02983 [Dorcoceras hygrometricum]